MATSDAGRLRYDPSVLGTSGVRQTGGFVQDEYLRDLRGAGGASTFRQMADNDGTVGAVLFAITMLVRSIEWTVQAADDSDEADAAKAFVEEVMDDMSASWSAVVSEICTMFAYGWAALEIVWKRRVGPEETDPTKRSRFTDGKIGVRNLSLRRQPSVLRWEFGEDGGIRGLWQQPVAGPEVLIPIEKLLLFRTVEEGNHPEGRSLLRTAYRAWYFKKRLEDIEAVGVERDLAGLPVGLIPGEYWLTKDPREQRVLAQWQDMVTRVRRDQQEGLLLPSDRDASGNLLFDFKLLSAGGGRSFDTSAIIDRYNRAIATSVLADFIFLGQQSVGSFALSSDKTALFSTALGAFTRSIADVLNRHLLPRLFRLNGMDLDTLPTINPGDLERPNLGEISGFIVQMVQAGAQMFPDRQLENALRKLAGLPEAPEDGPDMADQGVPGLDAFGAPPEPPALEGPAP